MRQGQQNRRGRGRGNGHGHQGRKGQNPLTRSFESNGPDIKIRGTPAHIAEKYMAMARDALSSGDPVLAENYLQHAEHYNRIIMAYREQQMSQAGGEFANGSANNPPRQRMSENADDADDGDGEEHIGEGVPQQAGRGQDSQPRSYDDRQQHRSRDRDRHSGDRNRYQGDRQPRGERASQAQPQGQPQGQPQSQPMPAGQAHEQPEFLRRPVRRPRRDDESEHSEASAPATAGSAEDLD